MSTNTVIAASTLATLPEDVRAQILAAGCTIVADTAPAPTPVTPRLAIVPDDGLTQEERAEDRLEAKHQARLERAELPVLTRARWNEIRRTRKGKGPVRKAFAGLTREQAFEAGLCEGFRLPTGAMKAALSQA